MGVCRLLDIAAANGKCRYIYIFSPKRDRITFFRYNIIVRSGQEIA